VSPRRRTPWQFAWDILRRAVSEFADDHCGQLASSVTFHVLFSIFPLVAVVAGVFGLVAGSGVRDSVVKAIVDAVPLSPSGDRELTRLLRGASGGVSAVGLVGLVGLLWSASGMMAALRTALDEAWDVERPRPWLKGKLVDAALVAAVGLVVLATLGLTIAARVATGVAGGWTGLVLGVLVPLGVGFAVVLFLYRVVPATPVSVRQAWPAALFVAAFFVVAQNLFALYLAHFGHYNAIYGSLGAIVAFMFFVHVNVVVFLFGAEVASEWSRLGLPEEGGAGEPFRARLGGFLRGLWSYQGGGAGERQPKRENRPRLPRGVSDEIEANRRRRRADVRARL
jgi:membrane protein